ncbi:MAG: hypothetical protein ACYC6Q_11840 [Syntrophales bacterium]
MAVTKAISIPSPTPVCINPQKRPEQAPPHPVLLIIAQKKNLYKNQVSEIYKNYLCIGHLQEGKIFMIAFVGTLPEFIRTRRQMFIGRKKTCNQERLAAAGRQVKYLTQNYNRQGSHSHGLSVADYNQDLPSACYCFTFIRTWVI